MNIVYVSIRRDWLIDWLIDWSVFNALSIVFQPLSAVLQQKSFEGNNDEKPKDCIKLQQSTFIENMGSNKILFSFEDYNPPTTATTTTTTTRATTTSTSKPLTTATLSEYFITRSWITIDPKIYKKWGQKDKWFIDKFFILVVHFMWGNKNINVSLKSLQYRIQS